MRHVSVRILLCLLESLLIHCDSQRQGDMNEILWCYTTITHLHFCRCLPTSLLHLRHHRWHTTVLPRGIGRAVYVAGRSEGMVLLSNFAGWVVDELRRGLFAFVCIYRIVLLLPLEWNIFWSLAQTIRLPELKFRPKQKVSKG